MTDKGINENKSEILNLLFSNNRTKPIPEKKESNKTENMKRFSIKRSRTKGIHNARELPIIVPNVMTNEGIINDMYLKEPIRKVNERKLNAIEIL